MPRVARVYRFFQGAALWLRILSLLAGIISSSSGAPVWAGGGPENLVLVVNQDDAGSLLLANHYVALRGIPAANVIHLSGVPRQTTITLDQFRTLILKPVFEAIRERKLDQQIDLIVYSGGFPASVNVAPAQEAFFREAATRGDPIPEELKILFSPTASLTALTYFAIPVLENQPVYFSLSSNQYFRGEAARLLTQPFVGDPAKQFDAALEAINAAEHGKAVEILKPLQAAHPNQVGVAWLLARAHAKLGEEREASEALTRAVRNGLQYRGLVLNEPAFKPLLDQPLFKGLVSRIPDERFDFLVSQGFSSRYCWAPNGSVNATRDQGMNYLLSTMLAHTWDTGLSEQDAVAALERSVAADGSQPKGTVYFTETSDVRTTTRKPNFAAAMLKLKRLKLESEVSQSTVPPGKQDIVGAMLGSAGINWPEYKCQIKPGAIVENLTSYGAVFGANPGHTQCTEFLKWGAAGSSGTVVEPYALQQKFPHPMIQVHYARGCSLAEAFYQSVEGPMQLLIVGDALCQPFARFPQVTAGAVPEEVKGTITIELSKAESSPEIAAVEIFLDGRLAGRRPGLNPVVFESEKVTDGYHELRLVAVASGLIQSRQTLKFPLWVNNRGESVTLTASEPEIDVDGKFELAATTSLPGPLQLLRGGEVLAENGAASAKFSIPAGKLGRGQVELLVAARDPRGRAVYSRPLKLKVKGPLRDKPLVVTLPPPPPPPSKPSAPNGKAP